MRREDILHYRLPLEQTHNNKKTHSHMRTALSLAREQFGNNMPMHFVLPGTPGYGAATPVSAPTANISIGTPQNLGLFSGGGGVMAPGTNVYSTGIYTAFDPANDILTDVQEEVTSS